MSLSTSSFRTMFKRILSEHVCANEKPMRAKKKLGRSRFSASSDHAECPVIVRQVANAALELVPLHDRIFRQDYSVRTND